MLRKIELNVDVASCRRMSRDLRIEHISHASSMHRESLSYAATSATGYICMRIMPRTGYDHPRQHLTPPHDGSTTGSDDRISGCDRHSGFRRHNDRLDGST